MVSPVAWCSTGASSSSTVAVTCRCRSTSSTSPSSGRSCLRTSGSAVRPSSRDGSRRPCARELLRRPRSSAPRRGEGRPVRSIVPVGSLAVIAVIGALVWLGFRGDLGSKATPTRPAASVSVAGPETPDQAVARKARVCEATRSRAYSGASLGPFDTEGWVAELWLAKHKVEDLAHAPVIAELAPTGKLAAGADVLLAALPDGLVEITSGIAGEGSSASGWSGVTVRFSGRYAGAFLDPELRPRFLALSERLAESLATDIAALYGRCAHLRYHDLGAWFRGADAGGAATALVYGIGLFAEVPAIDRGALDKLGAASDLDGLRSRAGKLDATTVATIVGAQGGSLTTTPASTVVTITFPLLGGTRAISASRAVARKLGVGVGLD